MRVFTTGGSGFIGTHLVESLGSSGCTVRSYDTSPPLNPDQTTSWCRGSVGDRDELTKALQAFQPTHVVHLAARTDLDSRRVEDYDVNEAGARHVIHAIREAPSVQRVVFASTMLVCPPGTVPAHPEDYRPHTAYGESKVRMERAIRQADIPCPWTIVRPTTIWGPWNIRMEKGLFRTLSRGLYLHPRGHDCWRSYGYAGNTAGQIASILAAPAQAIDRKTFYLADPPIRLLDFVNGFSRHLRHRDVRQASYGLTKTLAIAGDVASALGFKRIPLTSYRLSNMTTDNVLDIAPILAIAGPPAYSMEEGIRQTVQWLARREDPAPVS